jgi:hypothetical protein
MYVYIFASNRNTNDDHEYHYNPKKTGKNSISFHILTATLGKMANPRQCWSSDTHRRRHHCWDGTTSGCGREDHHAAAGVDA